jgi:general stress protein 26
MDRKIKNWMHSQDLNDYFTDGIIEPDWAMYTQLAEDTSAALGFDEGTEEDERCFELAVDVLDRYAA